MPLKHIVGGGDEYSVLFFCYISLMLQLNLYINSNPNPNSIKSIHCLHHLLPHVRLTEKSNSLRERVHKL